jgi:hypothetical protein
VSAGGSSFRWSSTTFKIAAGVLRVALALKLLALISQFCIAPEHMYADEEIGIADAENSGF